MKNTKQYAMKQMRWYRKRKQNSVKCSQKELNVIFMMKLNKEKKNTKKLKTRWST